MTTDIEQGDVRLIAGDLAQFPLARASRRPSATRGRMGWRELLSELEDGAAVAAGTSPDFVFERLVPANGRRYWQTAAAVKRG